MSKKTHRVLGGPSLIVALKQILDSSKDLYTFFGFKVYLAPRKHVHDPVPEVHVHVPSSLQTGTEQVAPS